METRLVPSSWEDFKQRNEWNNLFPLLYFHLDERQNRNVLFWIEENSRKYGHVPLWYMSLRNRLKHTQHILSLQEFEKLLEDMLNVTIRIVEDIVAFKKIYGILSSNAYSLLRNKLIAWIKKFEPKLWNPILETTNTIAGTDSWALWVKNWIPIQKIESTISTVSSSEIVHYNVWPSFEMILERVKTSLTPLENLQNTHCAWINHVYAVPLNTIVFGNVPESLMSTIVTNEVSARNIREMVRAHLFEIFAKFTTWDEFWNVSLNDLIVS